MRSYWSLIAIVTAFILVIASFNGWNGGFAFGPRYLVPIVPLLGIPMMAARLSPLVDCLAIAQQSFPSVSTSSRRPRIQCRRRNSPIR